MLFNLPIKSAEELNKNKDKTAYYEVNGRTVDFIILTDMFGNLQRQNICHRRFKGIYNNISDGDITLLTNDFESVHPWAGSPERADFNTDEEFMAAFSAHCRATYKIPSTYGVADNLRQILKYGRYFINSNKKYVLSINEVVNTHEAGSGFRWHKWGPYIGKKKPEHECFGDDKHDKVVIFEFIHVRMKKDLFQ